MGWNQNEADWRRLLELGQGVGIRDSGELVATATSIGYGRRLAWIGMVIVHESRRGQGFGKEVVRGALETARSCAESVGLDATHFGQPLYRGVGFEQVQEIYRWAGSLTRSPAVEAEVAESASSAGPAPLAKAGSAQAQVDAAEEAGPADLPDIASFDLQSTGVDRLALLRRLLAEPGTRGWLTRDGAGVNGYALLRPGRELWQLGPMVATGERQISALLQAAASRLDGEPLLLDVLDNEAMPGLLHRAGLESQRRLARMSLGGSAPTLTGMNVRLAAGLELG